MFISVRKIRDTYTIFETGEEVLRLDKVERDVEGMVDLSALTYYGPQVLEETVKKFQKLYPEVKGFRISKFHLTGADNIFVFKNLTRVPNEENYLFHEFRFNRAKQKAIS